MTATRSVLFTNAHAGGASRMDALVARANARGVEVVTLQRGDSFTEVIEAEVAKGAELLVGAGGDGTLTAVADVAMAPVVEAPVEGCRRAMLGDPIARRRSEGKPP